MIGIVIVNYNGAKFQNDAIRTIRAQTYSDYLIVVVDSGSTDGSLQLLRDEYEKDVVILEQNENVGVAVGNNIGMRYAFQHGCDYVLLLNNDVELAPDMLKRLVDESDEDTAVVPKIFYYDNPKEVWMAGGCMDWHRGEAYHLGGEDKGQFEKAAYITYAPTCAMLISKKIIDKVGFMDEQLFMYWDDTDLCVRILDAGFKIRYIPRAVMWHKVSSSSGGTTSKVAVYYIARNQMYFIDKYKERISFYTRCRIKLKGYAKAVLSPIRNKADVYILTAYKDYSNGTMGRKDF